MGILDDFLDGMFDFDGDGKTSLDEEYLAYTMFSEYMKEKNNSSVCNENDDDFDEDDIFIDGFDDLEDESEDDLFSLDDPFELKSAFDSDNNDDWKLLCEDGTEYDIFPEDYETEEEYEAALEDAKLALEDTCNNADEDALTDDEPEDDDELSNTKETTGGKKNRLEDNYPNKRQYDADVTRAKIVILYGDNYDDNQLKTKNRCEFILENADKIVAARYLTCKGKFLYAQAITDNFSLPVSLPQEDERRETEFIEVLVAIAKKDVPLCIKVWSWCIDEFLDYAEYEPQSRGDLTSMPINLNNYFPENFIFELIKYMSDNPSFRKRVIREAKEVSHSLPYVIAQAVKFDMTDIAKALFEDALVKADGDLQVLNELFRGIITIAYNELEVLQYAFEQLLPIAKSSPDIMNTDEIKAWEKNLSTKIEEIQNAKLEKELKKAKAQEIKNDKNIYIYCGVKLPFSERPYSFRTDDSSIKIGDTVVVPVGEDENEMQGTVVSVGHYARIGVPFPLEKTKFILRKVID
ncbi:MAG: hypothetical protein LIO62_03200 [Clostridiales bacterium]|nr:hypothetical protein [Clostridiales bacterium]